MLNDSDEELDVIDTLYPRDDASWTDLLSKSVPSPDLLLLLSVVTILISNMMLVST